jgi:leucyl aminopeptidase
MFRSVNLSNPVHPEAVVIGCYEGSDVSAAEAPEVQEAVRRPGFQAKVGEIVEAYPSGSPRIIVLGLGTKESLSSDIFRKVSGCLIRHIDKEKLERVDLRISSLRDPAMMGRCFGEAAGLLGWNCSTYRGTGTDPEEQIDLELGGNDEEFAEGIQRGLSLASASNLARELVFTPPEVATPAYMAKQAEMLANATGMECRVIEGDELAKEKLNGLRAVGRASDNKPCLIRLKYTPEGGSDLRPVVLIGKTITYDTGGLSLKGKTGMPGMKVDKGGGCAVLGAMKAIAEVIKPDFPVIALLPAAENFVSSNSYRPDDVIEYRNGVTVEVTNTDAEGRLVLADALCWGRSSHSDWWCCHGSWQRVCWLLHRKRHACC